MDGLDGVLEHLSDRHADGSRPEFVEAIERGLDAILSHFAGVAVVRDGRAQIILHRTPGDVRLLLAPTVSASDCTALRERLARDDRRLSLASELLGLVVGLPRGRLRTLGSRARRIVELGQQLAAA